MCYIYTCSCYICTDNYRILLLHLKSIDFKFMTKGEKIFRGEIDKLPDSNIYINVKHLNKGKYQLNILDHNKLIKKTTFKK